jgi:molecular chaperone GrpE
MFGRMKQKKQTEKTSAATENEMPTDNIADTTAETEVNQTEPKTTNEDKLAYTEEQYQLKVNELNDKYLRLYSEFDNFRKRSLKEKIELSRTASEDIIKDLLPVLDDFDRAISSMQNTDQIEALKEGVQLIYSKMKSVFASKGLQEINSKGQAFDTDFHEAVTSIPAPSEDLVNKVVDEIQKGYMLHDKVIRFSKVVTGS